MSYDWNNRFKYKEKVIYEPVPNCKMQGVVLEDYNNGVYEIALEDGHRLCVLEHALRRDYRDDNSTGNSN